MKRLNFFPALLALLLFASMLAYAEPIQGGDKDTVWMRYTTESSVIVRISKTNKYIAKFGSYTNIYDFTTGLLIKQLAGGEWGFFINNDQNLIRINQGKNGIDILDVNTWKVIASLPNEGKFNEFPFADISKDEKYMTVTTSDGFKVWDIGQRKLIGTKVIPLYENQTNTNVITIKFNCDNNIILQLAKTYKNPNNPNKPYVIGCITVFDFNTLDSINCLGNATNFKISSQCKYLAYSYFESTNGIKIFDINNKQFVWTLPTNGANLTDMEFSPDDKYLFATHQTGTDEQGMEVWNMSSGKMDYKYKSLGGGGYDCLNISEDGKYVAATRNILLYLYKTDGISGIINPTNTQLETIYPNPTNGTINLTFVLLNSAITDISVANTAGKRVHQLFNGFLDRGSQTMSFSVNGLVPGSYFVQIKTPSYSKVFKLIVNK